jgi:hypothetical protein
MPYSLGYDPTEEEPMTTNPIVSDVYFTLPTPGVGERCANWRDAVSRALAKIQRTEYKGQLIRPDSDEYHPRRHFQEGDTLVVYSRAFVELRVTEPVQPRPVGRPSGHDGPVMRWEVFHGGVVEALPYRN